MPLDRRLAAHDRRDPRRRGSPLLFASRHRPHPHRRARPGSNFRAGRIVEGGSTITQQLARAAQLSPVRTYERKIREVLIAARLEERYTKSQILEEYLQHRLFRRGLLRRRGRVARILRQVRRGPEPAEAALLAALVRSPSNDAPCAAPRARARAPQPGPAADARPGPHLARRIHRPRLAAAIPDRVARRRSAAARSRDRTVPASTSRKKSGASCSSCSAPTACCAAGFASTRRYDPATAARGRAARSRRASRRSRSAAARARDLQGSLVAMDPVTGDVLRARRRPRLPREQLQPRHAGAPSGGLGVQADHLRRGARARVCAGHAAARPRRADCSADRRHVAADRRARALRVHAAARAEGVEQPRRGAAAPAGRRDHRGLLRAAAGHRVAAADGAVARARHRRSDAARAHRRLQRVREPGLVAAPRLITRVEDAAGKADLGSPGERRTPGDQRRRPRT